MAMDEHFEEIQRIHAEMMEWRGRAEEAEMKLRRLEEWVAGHNGRVDSQTQ